MTTWSDEDSADEFDFMDPTSAPDPGAVETSAVDEDWRKESVPEGSTEHDFNATVHLWLTPDKRLAKIRISNRWRQRLKKSRLDTTVAAALKVHQLDGTGSDSMVEPEEIVTSEPIDQAFLNRWLESLLRMSEDQEKLKQDPEAAKGRWVYPSSNEGTSSNRMVTVKLGKNAHTTAVSIDDTWLKSARVSELCDAIQEAHDRAYAEFVEPIFEPGAYGKLAIEAATLEAESQVRARNRA